MLQHEEPVPSKNHTFQERCITPHELTRALSSIEAHREEDARRQEEEQRYLASTLTVDEAVSTLSLDVTADQLWTEVEALREADRVAPPGPPLTLDKQPFPTKPSPPAATSEAVQEGRPGRKQAVPLVEELPLDATRTWKGIAPEEQQHAHSENTSGVNALLSLLGGGIALACLVTWLAMLSTPAHSPYLYQPPAPTITQAYQPTEGSQTKYDVNAHIRDVTPDFYRKLKQTVGPNASLRLIVYDADWDLGPVRNAGDLYPLNAVPDGYIFHITSAGSPFGLRWGGIHQMAVVAFQGAQDAPLPSDALTYFRDRGTVRLRGWVTDADLSGMQQGKTFRFVSAKLPGIENTWVAFTQPLSTHSKVMNGQIIVVDYPAGQPIDVKSLTAEPTPQEPTNTPPHPSIFVFNGQNDGYYSAGFDASSLIKPLVSVPDGVPIHDTLRLVRAIQAQHMPLPLWRLQYLGATQPLQVDVRPGLHKSWTFIKHNGNLYVRGWIAARVTQARLKDETLNILNTPDSPTLGMTPTPVTLRVDNFNGDAWGGTEQEQTIYAHDVHLDSHAYEKWAP